MCTRKKKYKYLLLLSLFLQKLNVFKEILFPAKTLSQWRLIAFSIKWFLSLEYFFKILMNWMRNLLWSWVRLTKKILWPYFSYVVQNQTFFFLIFLYILVVLMAFQDMSKFKKTDRTFFSLWWLTSGSKKKYWWIYNALQLFHTV